MKWTILILLGSLLVWNCAGSGKTVESGPAPEKGEGYYDESFDPLTLNDDDIVISQNDENEQTLVPAGENEPAEATSEQGNEIIESEGFRVQVVATKNIETATMVEQRARDQFKSMNHKTYLIFETPMYKVRIGDARNREEAESIRELAQDYGYDEAFIVRSKVLLRPDIGGAGME